MDEKLILRKVNDAEFGEFKRHMREAFDFGAQEMGCSMPDGETVLPDADIEHSMSMYGAEALQIVFEGVVSGGAIVTGDDCKRQLDFLFIDVKAQNKHIGQTAWCALEARYPKAVLWETCTPYNDIRNVYFYLNRCGFNAVGLFRDKQIGIVDGGSGAEKGSDQSTWMVEFQKRMNV